MVSFPEKLLHLIWQQLLFNIHCLKSTNGEELQIISGGKLNTNAGPDFEEAQLRIGSLVWYGAIEIHLKSSDWYKHQHQKDPAYNQVILHVVYEHDQNVTMQDGRILPTLELKTRIAKTTLLKSRRLLQTNQAIACAQHLQGVPMDTINILLEEQAGQRLFYKAQKILLYLKQLKYDWNTVFYLQLARVLAGPINAEPMEQLIRSTPIKIAYQQIHFWQREALFLGQAGLLEGNFLENYPNKLKNAYQFMCKKYSLSPLPALVWKRKGMRPTSFPSLRIAMLVQLLQHPDLFRKVVEAENPNQLWALFNVSLKGYWTQHYRLDQLAKQSYKKQLTKTFFNHILINLIIPIRLAYAQSCGNKAALKAALLEWKKLAVEKNKYLKIWAELGLKPKNALESQALLELYKNSCMTKKCLDCKIGRYLLFH